jgi:hypothetical protein
MRQNARVRIPLGAVALAPLALVFAATAEAQHVKIEVTSVTTQVKAHDLPPKGKPNKGDTIAFKDLLLNMTSQFGKATGKAVAYDAGTLVYTSATETTMQVTAIFPGVGTLRFGGPFRTKHGQTVLPVIGGTGAFKGVKGTVTIGSGATRAPNVYDLRMPHAFDVHATGVA